MTRSFLSSLGAVLTVTLAAGAATGCTFGTSAGVALTVDGRGHARLMASVEGEAGFVAADSYRFSGSPLRLGVGAGWAAHDGFALALLTGVEMRELSFERRLSTLR